MPSERIQRRIDALLDEADQAIDTGDWDRARGRALDALALDPENEDARTILGAAEQRTEGAPPETTSSPASTGPHAGAVALPTSFASGRYAVQRFLGEGGRKRVYLAHDTRLDRDVAVAIIKTEGLDMAGLARVRNEAQAMARLGDQPNIVTVFDVGEDGGSSTGSGQVPQPYMVSQYMAGGSVEELIAKAQDHRLPLEQTLSIAGQVCHALEHAHKQGIVHRDLKPGNVWLGTDGAAKLGDFGLAVALDRSRVTMAGTMLGTVAYMPPEQALGGESTPKADLYSLGCMLYEMVTGRPPFLGEDPTAVISQHINTPPVAPSWLSDRCPPDLEEVILRLLAKSPDQRPESATEVRAALAKVDPAQKSASHSDSTENPLDRLARGVFVGRHTELEKLRKTFDEAFAGHGSLVMLVGEPGIGKTRTAQELETRARMRTAAVLWGRTHESSGAPPYWPWYQVGNAYAATNDMAPVGQHLPPGANGELSRIFPWLRQQPDFVEPEPITDPESAQFRLFEAYAAFIRAMAGQRPLLIALDDLHWADKPTLLLLQHLARELSRLRVLIVGTYRDTDLSRTHPLSETLAALNRDPGFTRIVLRGLTQPEVGSYIRVTANVEPRPELVRRIFEETEGNPFFLSEVINLMAQEGTLTRESVSDIRIPDGVKEALGRRLDRVSPEANELLQMCAIAGREFTYDTLTLTGDPSTLSTGSGQAGSRRTEDQLLRLIEEVLKARVIEEMEQPGRYRFTHALMQETLLDELSTTRRVRLHGQVAEALERRWGDRLAAERAPRLAHHFVEAAMLGPSQARKAVLYSKLAAEQAEATTAWDEAARHYESCLALITASEEAPSTGSGHALGEDEAALLVALGRCLRYGAQNRAAWRSFMRATTIYRERGDGAAMAGAALEASEMFAPRDRLVTLAEEALSVLGVSDLGLRAQLLLMRAGEDWDDASKAAAAEAARIVHTLNDPALLGRLLNREALEAAGEKRIDEAVALFRRAHGLLDEGGERQRAAESLRWAAFWKLFEGKLDEGLASTKDALAYAGKFHVRPYELICLAYLQAAALIRCDFPQFDSIVNDVPGDNFYIPMLCAARAEMSGDTDAALKLAPTPDAPGGVPPTNLAQLLGSLARTSFNAGHEDEAREYLEEWRREFDQLPPTALHYRLLAIAELDEGLPAPGDESLIRALYKELAECKILRYSPPDGRGLDHARGALALRLERVDEARDWYQIGLEWAERERCPVESGRCLQGLAEVAQRRGETRDALQHLDRAIALFQQHGAKLYLNQAVAMKVRLQGIAGRDIHSSIEAVHRAVESEHPDLRAAAADDGSVTIMFSDIAGSTARAEALGDERWLELIRSHNAIVREQVQAHAGREVANRGDGFMVAFASPRAAVDCAIAIQRAFAKHTSSHEHEPIEVHIGLHVGRPAQDEGNFYGTDVNLAARLGDHVAHAGQIVVSERLREALRRSRSLHFDEGREVELKGLSGRHRVYEVMWDG